MPPDKEIEFLSRGDLLSYEEIVRIVSILKDVGLRKVRLTGGEPLVRSDLERLVSMLKDRELVDDIALTTNGYLLKRKAKDLYEAGLNRLTVSLFTLREDRFATMAGREVSIREVIDGIETALALGFYPIKVNAVVVRGVNDDETVDIARFCRERGIILRLIEYMDVGTLNSWDYTKVVSKKEMLGILREHFDFYPVDTPSDSTAQRFAYADTGLEFGIISSVTEPFCRGCTRLRLSADGKIFTCLFSTEGHDLKKLIRNGSSDEQILNYIVDIWKTRDDRYSELRLLKKGSLHRTKVEMFKVGG